MAYLALNLESLPQRTAVFVTHFIVFVSIFSPKFPYKAAVFVPISGDQEPTPVFNMNST